MSKAKRSEIARVYSIQNTVAPLERNFVFHRAIKHIDECLVEIVRKTTRPLEVIGIAEKKYSSKKVLGFFCETFAENQKGKNPRRNLEHLARRRGKPSKINISRISLCF
jgi:hypothetical protein